MTDPVPSTLKRLAGAGRPPPDHGVVSPIAALRLALSKAAQDVARAPLSGGAVVEQRITLAGMAQALPQGGLWILVQGPGRSRGLVTFDQSLLSALIQALTTGKISKSDIVNRLPTQTDAILVRRFLTLMLETLAKRLTGHPSALWAVGFQPRDRVSDVGRLPHLLPDVVFRGLTLEVDIGNGQRQGSLSVILPERADLPEQDESDGVSEAAFAAAMARKISHVPVVLEAVLYRMQMSLDEVSSLEPGTLLSFPRHALSEVTLHGSDGTHAGVARLGQSGGFRAVKLVSAPGLPDAAVPLQMDTEGQGTPVVADPDPSEP